MSLSLFERYKQQAIDKIKESNPESNPELKNTVYDIITNIVGAFGATQQTSIQNASNGSYAQFASGNQLDYRDFSLGMTPRRGTTSASVQASNLQPPVVEVTLTAGTQFTSDFNGGVYILSTDTVIPIAMLVPVSLESQQAGEGYQLREGTTLQTVALPNVVFSVDESSDGESTESDAELQKRILDREQNPQGAGREGDYQEWAFEAAPDTVTDVYTVQKFVTSSLTIGVFILVGTADFNEVVLDTLTLYSRTANADIIQSVSDFIQAERGINQSFLAASVATFEPIETIDIQVTLPEGVTLATTTTNFNGEGITVENFIKQELRRSIVSYPVGGTQDVVGGTAALLISRLEQGLDSSLSFYSGVYARLLVDRKILIDGSQQDMVAPYNVLDANGNVLAVYDRLPATMTVTVI